MRIASSVIASTAAVLLHAAPAALAQKPATGDTAKPITGTAVPCTNGKAKGYECQNVQLLSFLPSAAIGAKTPLPYGSELTIIINDMWGWTDSTSGHEYALVGRTDGTAFIDVTDPLNPKYLGDLPLPDGASPSFWRDIKVYKNYAFVVADMAGPHGMQVFDLTQLRNVKNAPVTFKEAAHYDNFDSAHNIVINPESGFAYVVGASSGGETCGGALHMIDIHNPLKPAFAGCYAEPSTGNAGTGYTHDAQCVNYHGPDAKYKGREVCFDASETAVGIADVTDKKNPKTLSTVSYPNVSYAHQGWLSDDQRYFFLDDETDEESGLTPKTRTLVFDVSKLNDPVLIKEFQGTTAATDHNLYVRDHYAYEANYKAGLRILDIKDPKNPAEVGYFDTTPTVDNTPGYAGAWSNYPFFKSGAIGISSISEGFYLVRFTPPGTVGK